MRHPSATQSLPAPKLPPKQECGHGRIFQIQIGPKTCFQLRPLPHPATNWPPLCRGPQLQTAAPHHYHCRATTFIPSNPTAQETEMGPSIPYLPSYDRETNGTTFSYKNTRFSYADGPTPATTMGPRQQASRSGPAPRWDTSFPYLRESGLPRGETFYLHFSATAQLWRKDNYTRNSRLLRYKNIISSYDRSRVPATRQPPPAPPLSYGTPHVLSCIPPSRCACPPPLPYPALSTSCPFLI